jgi:hypothetical protein
MPATQIQHQRLDSVLVAMPDRVDRPAKLPSRTRTPSLRTSSITDPLRIGSPDGFRG